jgi:hypothetical protein
MAEAEETGDPAATLAEAAKLRGKSGREMLLAELLLRAGGQALSRRQWGLSVQGLEEAYELEKQHGGFPDLRFRITLSLAAVFFGMARYDRARFHAEQALEIACSHFGDDDPRTAIALSTLGSLLLVTNDVSRAEQLMRKALVMLMSPRTSTIWLGCSKRRIVWRKPNGWCGGRWSLTRPASDRIPKLPRTLTILPSCSRPRTVWRKPSH